jgi:hypothetical protein
MEFRFQYLTAMREQNPKLMRRLEKSGQLDRLVNLKAGEASRLYQQIVAGKPKTLQNEREAEEQVKGMMFEFPYDMDDVPEGRPERPAQRKAPRRLTQEDFGDLFDEIVSEPESEESAAKASTAKLDHDIAAIEKALTEQISPKARKTLEFKLVELKAQHRPAAEIVKSAVKNAASAADDAFAALTKLFGGGKTIGMGLNVDEDTYAKAKPMFTAAAEKFSKFKCDVRELMRRMLDHLRDAYKWTSATISRQP